MKRHLVRCVDSLRTADRPEIISIHTVRLRSLQKLINYFVKKRKFLIILRALSELNSKWNQSFIVVLIIQNELQAPWRCGPPGPVLDASVPSWKAGYSAVGPCEAAERERQLRSWQREQGGKGKGRGCEEARGAPVNAAPTRSPSLSPLRLPLVAIAACKPLTSLSLLLSTVQHQPELQPQLQPLQQSAVAVHRQHSQGGSRTQNFIPERALPKCPQTQK
jgi:hypothetical protein